MSENNFCYKECVPKNVSGPNDIPITIKVSDAMVNLLDQLAEQNQRTRSAVTRMLLMKGLRLYEADNTLLDVPLGAPYFEIGAKREQKKTKTG